MPGNSFGELFRITTWGESHGGGVGVVIDGCPPNLNLSEEDIQMELDRRRPGQSDLTTPRKETDTIHILSGIFQGKTLGTPISMMVWNKDVRSEDYAKSNMSTLFRPGHADYTYEKKYGIRNWQGGGRSSARETVGRVAAGAIAKKLLSHHSQAEILAYVKQVHTIEGTIDPERVSRETIEATPTRCPDPAAAQAIESRIVEAKEQGDSVGGVVECVVRQPPIGLGEPVFDKIDADLAKACLSIPATKGFEIGSGFVATTMKGSEHNDSFYAEDGLIKTTTNYAGGSLGGITNGAPLVLRIAFKPTSTIAKEQKTVDASGGNAVMEAKGRHDPCVLPRAVPIVEAMVSLVLADHLLRWQGQCGIDFS
jgi:chorismate synthase